MPGACDRTRGQSTAGVYQEMHKLTVAKYARLMNVSEATARRKVKSGELNSELIDGVTHIILERLPTDSQGDNQSLLVAHLQEEIERQQAEIEYLRNELSESRQRSDTIILQLTKQLETQTLMLEDMRNRSFWRRIKIAFRGAILSRPSAIRFSSPPVTEQRGI